MATVDSAERSAALAAAYDAVRTATVALCAPLALEDYVVQAAPEASPPRWHLAHTTWFFETFVLAAFLPHYRVYDTRWAYLFNSYYEGAGPYFPRARRGTLARPTVAEILRYRQHVDEAVHELLTAPAIPPEAHDRLVVGLHHEQQHQELLVTDILRNFSLNPLGPAFLQAPPPSARHAPAPLRWLEFPEGLYDVGFDGPGFAFDNERPRHPVWVPAFRLASRLVTNGEYLAFVEDGGYQTPRWWLSDGWQRVCAEEWDAPLYWRREGESWEEFTAAGWVPLDPERPVCHVSYFEADAFARWAHKRLPTEAEWEVAASAASHALPGRFLEDGTYHPAPAPPTSGLTQMLGDLWEWTASTYAPYPGFRPWSGTLGEYNGKFMCNQYVLRGGSCATPRSHIRVTYRNFFPPDARWQFTGIRLAEDVS